MRDRVANYLRMAALAMAGVLLVINLAVVSHGVITRYVMGGSPIWSDELSRYLIIATVMLAAGAVWSEGLHMRVGILERLLPGPAGRVVRAYQWLLTLALAGFGAWIGWQYAWSVSAFRTMGLGISRTVPLLCVPVGFALLFAHALLRGPRPLPSATDTDTDTPADGEAT
ncbi:TRAP transporter small permease [Arhodomonas sp. AD133]|uniref:TRAP transporter small permease n=1 Tax=Arhodomonas sp. AD133 TaxID=3415009 RepID=UPI003EBA97CD